MTLFIFSITDMAFSQTWQKFISKPNLGQSNLLGEKVLSINGGYLVADLKLSGSLFKTDYNGNVLWYQSLNKSDVKKAVISNAEGGFVIGGALKNNVWYRIQQLDTLFYSDFGISKYNSEGDKIWEKKLIRGLNSQCVSIHEMSNGNYLALGTFMLAIDTPFSSNSNNFIYILNPAGDSLFYREYNGTNHWYNCVGTNSNNDILLASNTSILSVSGINGDTLDIWSLSLGLPNPTNQTEIIKLNSGSVYYGNGFGVYYLINSIGNILRMDSINSLYPLQNGGFVTARVDSNPYVNRPPVTNNRWLVLERYNNNYIKEWIKYLPDTTINILSRFSNPDIIETTNGDYVVVGSYFTNTYLAYVDSNGNTTNYLDTVLINNNYGFNYLDAGNIRSTFNSDGGLFWDYQNHGFEAPKGSGLHTIFSSGLWLSGIDNNGSLYTANEFYKQSGQDFWSGPLDNAGTINYSTTGLWSKVWRVNISDIISHVNDFLDNQIIDNPIAEIFSWPGKGNAFAKGKNDLSLSVNIDAAPFNDLNHNGIYEPQYGEYPKIQGDQMIWFVFNDAFGEHSESGGKQLHAEIQVSAYTYSNPSAVVPYNTIFTDYKIINKSGIDYNEFYFGNFVDFDLGCFLDDYIGCDTTSNTFYAYNGRTDDPDCAIMGYGDTVPVQTVTFLNKKMTSFKVFFNDFTLYGNPINASHFYYYMTGKWKDGNIMSYGGNGYGGNQPILFLFDGNPVVASEWSMCEANYPIGNTDFRSLGVSGPNMLSIDSSITYSLAYYFARADSSYGGCFDYNDIRPNVNQLSQIYLNASAYTDSQISPIPDSLIISGVNQIAFNNRYFSIYPNPTNHQLNIITYNTSTQPIYCQIINTLGSIVASHQTTIPEFSIDVSALPAGIYFIHLQSGNAQTVKRFVKE